MQSLICNSAAVLIWIPCLLFLSSRAGCEVLRVPSQYSTIQAALDSMMSWDTVLVEPGVYHEFLIDPDHPFTLSGLYSADTVESLQTILDPIAVLGPDTPSVFMITGDTVLIKNFAFFNRPELRQYDGAYTRSGALRNYAHLLRVENCRFDSVSSAIWGGNAVVVEGSKFVGCTGQCIIPFVEGRVEAYDSEFESGAFSLVTAYGGSRFVACVFSCNTSSLHFLNLSRSDILIERCKFGPCVAGSPVVSLSSVQDVIIQDCLFEGLRGASQIIQVSANCNNTIDAPVLIRRCVFRDFVPDPPRQGVTAVVCQCTQGTAGLSARIEQSRFVHGEHIGVLPPGIEALSNIEIYDCVFDSLSPLSAPDVWLVRPNQDTIIARNNSFLPPGLAAGTAGSYFDARENWWGDSTGPFNASLNPTGLGSEVGSGVLFSPWLTQNPDSADSTSAFDERIVLSLPFSSSMVVFPNPFNAVTTLVIEVARAGEYEVLLYDVTGRVAANVFRGRIEHSARVSIDATALASGVFFAQLTGQGDASALTKLLYLK